MKLPSLARTHVIVACICVFGSRAFAQGPLTPPGAPAPTMKTLDQIASTGIAINAINTPGDSANQFIINAPGHYYLTGNITGVSGMRGILLNSVDITIDLNGFAMVGVAGSGVGISDGGVNRGNVTICNGKIAGWGFSGIFLATSFDSIIHDLIVTNNGQYGITCGDDCNIRDCAIRDNSFSNVVTGFNANISHCSTVGSATGRGFDIGQDSTISNCVANFNHAIGIVTAPGCRISQCTANENTGGGIQTGDGCTVTACSAYKNVGSGIACGIGCTVADSSAYLNSGGGSVGAISVLGGSTVDNCSASNNSLQYGISAVFACTVVHCAASYNQSALSTSAGIFAPGGTVKDCTCNNNATTNASPTGLTGMGIYSNNFATVIQSCNASFNAGDGINVLDRNEVRDNYCSDSTVGAGVHVMGGNNRVEGNQVANNSVGILVDATINLVFRNTARGNTPNYSIVAGNRVATIVTPAVNSAISGNTGGTAFSTDAAVNIAY